MPTQATGGRHDVRPQNCFGPDRRVAEEAIRAQEGGAVAQRFWEAQLWVACKRLHTEKESRIQALIAQGTANKFAANRRHPVFGSSMAGDV